MSNKFYDITFTDGVKEAQERYGSRRQYAKSEGGREKNSALSDAEIDFIETRDGFYMATVGEQDQPYIWSSNRAAGPNS